MESALKNTYKPLKMSNIHSRKNHKKRQKSFIDILVYFGCSKTKLHLNTYISVNYESRRLSILLPA